MADQVQAAAQPAQPVTLTYAQAAQKYAESKAEAANKVTNISDAARTLGQRGAQARQERQANAPQTSEPPQEEEQQDDAQNTAQSTPGETTETDETLAGEKDANQEDATASIDLGDGITLTKDEIRGNILRQADYTRKMQGVAEDRKAVDAERSTKLKQLDEVIGALQQRIGKPKSLKEWLKADPINGVSKFADEAEQVELAGKAILHKQAVEAEQISKAITARDKELSESYNPEWSDPTKRDQAYTALSQYALSKGADPDEVRMMTKPWMIKVLHDGWKNAQAEAGKSKITKLVAGKPQVVRPGSKVSAQSHAATGLQQAQATLKASGSIADAVALLRARRGTG